MKAFGEEQIVSQGQDQHEDHNEQNERLKKELLSKSSLDEGSIEIIEQVFAQLGLVTAENIRLRKALLRVSASQPKMSTKLKDALWE